MLPTSIAGSMRIGVAVDEVARPRRCARRTARRRSRGPARRPAGAGPAGWRPRPSRRTGRRRRRASSSTRHVGADRADEARRAEPLLDLVGLRRAGSASPRWFVSLMSLTRWSPRTTTRTKRAAVRDDRDRTSAARPGATPRWPATASIVVAPGRRRPRRARRAPAASSTGCGVGARDLDVRRVARRERDVVLARRARRHVLVRAAAAHHPDVGLHAVPLQARCGRRSGRRRRCAWRSSRPGPSASRSKE